MRTLTVEALVLRRWDVGEMDRMVSMFTRERGKLRAVAKGARKSASKLAGVTEPGACYRVHLAMGRKVFYVTQAEPRTSFPPIRKEYRRLMACLAFLETVDHLLPEAEPAPEVFDLALKALEGISLSKEPLGALAWADLRLMELSGFAPEFRVSVLSGKPLRGERRWLSPRAGGAVNEEEKEGAEDRFPVRREVAIALAKLQERADPPDYLQYAPEVTIALLSFWQEFIGHFLPARHVLRESLMVNQK
jgi:DNA repair protein RecO (recombination protein O)